MSNRFYLLGLSLITLALGYLTYLLFSPFLAPIAWAVVLSLVFYPIYMLILRYVKIDSLASLLTITLIILIIVGPFSYITIMLIEEIRTFAVQLSQSEQDILKELLENPHIYRVVEKMLSMLNTNIDELEKKLLENLSGLGMTIISNFTKNIGNVLGLMVDFVIMIFTTFFLLKDGHVFIKHIYTYMPFSEEQKIRLGSQFRDIIVSTVYGGVIVSVLQGVVTGFTLSLLGFKSPVLWGVATAVLSFVPLLGASTIWFPASIYLFIEGSVTKGVILILVGFFVISMIDNLLKPVIIGSRTKLPVLIIFFSVLGGISVFGIVGLIAGPLVVALFFSVLQIFREINIERDNKRA